MPGPREGPGESRYPDDVERPGPGPPAAAGSGQGEGVRGRGRQGQPQERGRPPGAGEPGTARGGRRGGGGGIPHGGRRAAAVRPRVPLPGRGAPPEERDEPGAGGAAERPEGGPEIPGRPAGAGPFLRDAEGVPEGGRELAQDPGGEPVGPGGPGRPGRCVPGGEGAGEGGKGVRGDQAPGAEAAVRVREDGRIITGRRGSGTGRRPSTRRRSRPPRGTCPST